jgi:hypothetical protein
MKKKKKVIIEKKEKGEFKLCQTPTAKKKIIEKSVY